MISKHFLLIKFMADGMKLERSFQGEFKKRTVRKPGDAGSQLISKFRNDD